MTAANEGNTNCFRLQRVKETLIQRTLDEYGSPPTTIDSMRPVNDSMRQKRYLDGPFPGGILNPPLHIQCRCATGLKFL